MCQSRFMAIPSSFANAQDRAEARPAEQCSSSRHILASQCACMRTVVRRLAACDSKPLLTPPTPAGKDKGARFDPTGYFKP